MLRVYPAILRFVCFRSFLETPMAGEGVHGGHQGARKGKRRGAHNGGPTAPAQGHQLRGSQVRLVHISLHTLPQQTCCSPECTRMVELLRDCTQCHERNCQTLKASLCQSCCRDAAEAERQAVNSVVQVRAHAASLASLVQTPGLQLSFLCACWCTESFWLARAAGKRGRCDQGCDGGLVAACRSRRSRR